VPIVVIRLPGTSRRPRTRGTIPAATQVPPLSRKRVTVKLGAELLTLPVTSPQVEHTDISADWVQINRGGQFPLVRKAGPRLRQMRFDTVFKAGGRPVEGGLRLLDRFANAEQPLAVAYGPLEGGLWRLVDVRIRSTRRQPGSNAIVEAEATLTFLEHVADGYARPTSARPSATTPAPRAAAPRPVASKAPAAAAAPRIHVVQRGDTLSKIAAKFYGDANRYPEIARANGIRNPNLIKVGQRLKVP
jgi:LysM repeat protein